MKSESIIEIVILIGLILGGVWIYNALFKHDKWSLQYENPITGMVSTAGIYDTRQECEQKLYIAKQNPEKYGRPECGSNCKLPTTANGPYICDDTFDL